MTLLLAMLAVILGAPTEYGIATNFGGKADKHRGGDSPCIYRKIERADHGIAHRTLPCGSWIIVVNPRTRKATLTTVIDRGPYGAIHEGQWVLKRRRQDPGRWRGVADLSYAAAESIDHNSFERIILIKLGER